MTESLFEIQTISTPWVSIYFYKTEKTQQNNNKQICSPSLRSWRLAAGGWRLAAGGWRLAVLSGARLKFWRSRDQLICSVPRSSLDRADGVAWVRSAGRPSIKMAASSKRSLYNPAPSQTPPPQIRYFGLVWKIISYSLSYFKASMS